MFGKILSVLLDTKGKERRKSRPERSAVQFSLDPVARMGRPADRQPCFSRLQDRVGREVCTYLAVPISLPRDAGVRGAFGAGAVGVLFGSKQRRIQTRPVYFKPKGEALRRGNGSAEDGSGRRADFGRLERGKGGVSPHFS